MGGATIHSWGNIPVNATDAANEVEAKGTDGDVDSVFVNAQGIRFLVIDEVSTASPMLLGLLDAYLRRACGRRPYARLSGRRRPFGGINIIFAGDFWQLTPVRAHALFSNPFKKGCYSAEEQKILKMFWTPEDVDSIQRTFVLTEPMRTKDPMVESSARCRQKRGRVMGDLLFPTWLSDLESRLVDTCHKSSHVR